VKKIFALLMLGALALNAQEPQPAETETKPRVPLVRPSAGRTTVQPPGFPPAPAPSTIAPQPDAEVRMVPSPEAVAKKNDDLDQVIPGKAVDFVAVKLDQVLKLYTELVGKTLLRQATLNSGDIVLTTQPGLTKREVIQALEAVLALNGIALVHMDDKFVKVVPQAQANTEGAPFGEKDASLFPSVGTYITHVVQLKYVKPTELQPLLQGFGKIPNGVYPIDASQMLVLRDYAENVKRMLELIKKVDVAFESEFISEVIPIKYALASDIAGALNSLGGSGGGSTSVGGARTSSRPTGGASSLNRGGGVGGNYGGGGFGNTGGFGQQNTGLNTLGGGNAGGLGTPSGSTAFSDRLQRIISRASSSNGDLQLLGTTKIISDERMNALLVFATRQDMNTITNIIAKLDVVLAQVLIETIIMDVTYDNTLDFNVSGIQKPRQWGKDFTGAGGANANQVFDFASAGTNAFGQLVGSGLKYFGLLNDDFLVSLRAAATDGRVNVIQKPRIQTSHATPASLFIGNTVPYVTSTYYGGGFGGSPGSSYQQLRVGIGLDVTPFINPEGLVVMQIQEAIDEISGSTEITGVGQVPNTTSRTLSGEVAVRDGETIVLGGFMRNFASKTKSGIPLLKDIPLLGNLFRSTSSAKQRSELLVLMQPTVLRTPELAAIHVDSEKKRLPGVSEAERELLKFENKANEAEEKKRFKERTPFTAEEMKLYGTPKN
jgi:general secretion pathway protein D